MDERGDLLSHKAGKEDRDMEDGDMTDKAKGTNDGGHYEPGVIIVEGDLVVAHGRYSSGGKTLIATDFFRFEGDFVVEHWDVLHEVAAGGEAADRSAIADPSASFQTPTSYHSTT